MALLDGSCHRQGLARVSSTKLITFSIARLNECLYRTALRDHVILSLLAALYRAVRTIRPYLDGDKLNRWKPLSITSPRSTSRPCERRSTIPPCRTLSRASTRLTPSRKTILASSGVGPIPTTLFIHGAQSPFQSLRLEVRRRFAHLRLSQRTRAAFPRPAQVVPTLRRPSTRALVDPRRTPTHACGEQGASGAPRRTRPHALRLQLQTFLSAVLIKLSYFGTRIGGRCVC